MVSWSTSATPPTSTSPPSPNTCTSLCGPRRAGAGGEAPSTLTTPSPTGLSSPRRCVWCVTCPAHAPSAQVGSCTRLYQGAVVAAAVDASGEVPMRLWFEVAGSLCQVPSSTTASGTQQPALPCHRPPPCTKQAPLTTWPCRHPPRLHPSHQGPKEDPSPQEVPPSPASQEDPWQEVPSTTASGGPNTYY